MCLAHHLVRPVIALLLLTVSLLLRTSLNFVYADGVSAAPNDWTTERKYIARDKVRDLFYHGYNSYLQYAWPLDELAPLSCAGRGPDWHKPENIAVNDVNGNFSLTLIDTLDTLVVFGDPVAFEDAVQRVISHVSFNVDTKPQIFEANIRVLGGLLSGHIFASKKGHPFYLPWYDGELLELAHDLGKRFLPAFSTPTGIPYARINLRHGVPKGESLESCAAGAGSLILEFATLSRLTGDARFEKVARKAFFAIWNARSDIGLVGNQINLWTGAWQFPLMSSIGAGIDSFFEYALKWYVLSGDPEFLDVWNESYASVMRYSRSQDGLWFRRVDLNTGNLMYYTLDSLSAFWPGLQVLAGDIENAIKSHMLFWNLWQRYSGLPEVWDMSYKTATSMAFPLRPEFVESTWYLYRATRDPFYLDVGERILNDLTSRSRVMCGLTGIADLRTNQRDDRMESFVLSETLKYLYLLFDEGNPLHADDSNWVFTTEGHILSLDIPRQTKPSKVVRELRRHEAPQCPSYMPPEFGSDQWHAPGLEVGVRSRPDWDYATHLVGGPQFNDTRAAAYWHAEGICTTPEVDMYTFEFIMSIGGEQVVEDMSPGKSKVAFVPDGFVVHGVAGIRTRVTTRLDGRGYDITKLGPYTVRTGQIVYVKDTELLKMIRASGPPDDAVRERSADVSALFFIDFKNDKKVAAAAALGGQTQIAVSAQTALFGGDPGAPPAHEILPAAAPEGVAVVRDRANPFGCDQYAAGAFGHSGARDAAVFLVRRGECTFLEKLQRAREAGAAGVIVVSHEDMRIQPSAEPDEIALAGAIDDVVALSLSASEGAAVQRMADAVETLDLGRLVMVLERAEGNEVAVEADGDAKNGGVLHINGHPLVNTKLTG